MSLKKLSAEWKERIKELQGKSELTFDEWCELHTDATKLGTYDVPWWWGSEQGASCAMWKYKEEQNEKLKRLLKDTYNVIYNSACLAPEFKKVLEKVLKGN